MSIHPDDPSHAVVQVAAVGSVALSWLGVIPAFVALIAGIYYLLCIWESVTIQGWLIHHRTRAAERRVEKMHNLRHKLNGQLMVLDAELEKSRARSSADH